MHPLTHETPASHTVKIPIDPFALSTSTGSVQALSKGRIQSPARFLM